MHVNACPPSPTYRIGKFIQRHKTFAIGLTAVFVALLIGVVTTSSEMVRANKAEKELAIEVSAMRTQLTKAQRNALGFQHLRQLHRNFETEMSLLVNQLGQTARHEQNLSDAELMSLRTDIMLMVVGTWEKAIEFDRRPNGTPGPFTAYYRRQRALAIARTGNHESAFQELAELESMSAAAEEDPLQWALDLARICSLCGEAAKDDAAQSETYIQRGILYLHQLVDAIGEEQEVAINRLKNGIKNDPSEAFDLTILKSDPDLDNLRSRVEFNALMQFVDAKLADPN